MAEPISFPASLQESILAALVFDENYGAAISVQVTVDDFDEVYRPIAEKVLAYRAKFRKPPSRAHLDDLFGELLSKERRPTALRRMLFNLSELGEGLNAEYVAGKVEEFVRRQQLKGAILDASARYDQGGADLIPEVEAILQTGLRARSQMMDAGLFMNDPKALRFLEKRDSTNLIPLGIAPFDEIGVGLVPKELLLFVAPKGRGKTWFCVHCGKQAAKYHERVLHITLEVREEVLAGRYMQSIFAGAQRDVSAMVSIMELDDLKRLSGIDRRSRKAKVVFSSRRARKILLRKQKSWGTRLGRVVIKEFPTSQLTVPQLSGYMDFLESTHKFIPTVLLVDYPDLMRQNSRDLRLSLRQTYESLRGLASQRNVALVAPTQSNRTSLFAKQTTTKMVSEDVSKIQTADTVITYSATPEERRLGLARLFLAHSRDTRDDLSVIITQNYPHGQFALDAVYYDNRYSGMVRDLANDEEYDEEEE